MRLTDRSLQILVDVITGNNRADDYRSGPQLVNFLNSLGEKDLYGSGFPSRHVYVRQKLDEINGSSRVGEIITAAFNQSFSDEAVAEDFAYRFSQQLAISGFVLENRRDHAFYQGGETIGGPLYFLLSPIENSPKVPEILLSEASLKDQIDKALARLNASDFSGAISICYTLIEVFLKLSLEAIGETFNWDEGDIKKLYKQYARNSALSVSEDTPDPLKPILSGLSSLVTGFYDIANKAGDRHHQKYRADRHHARLVINLTFAFCEFLLASRQRSIN